MSSSLVRRGLELFQEDVTESGGSSIKRRKKDLSSSNRKDLLPLISSSPTGVKKQLKRLKGNTPRNKTTVKEMKMKSAFDKLSKHKTEDHTDSNVNFLLKMDRSRDRFSSHTNKIIEHCRGKLAKDNPLPETEQEETSVFTEEDFKSFEESYVPKRKFESFLLDYQNFISGKR